MAAKKEKQDLEAEVWNAITAFEQILEAMPNDRASLEALSHAYEQIGDLTKAKEYFVRLGNVLLDEGDAGAGGDLLGRLRSYAADDAEVAELVAKMEAAGGAPAPAEAGSAVEAIEPGVAEVAPDAMAAAEAPKPKKKAPQVSTAFNMAEELAMAWNLMEANELTQEEYASVVQDLTEMSAGDSTATISVLHVLEARGFKHIEKVIAYLAENCTTPFVSLENFDLTWDAAKIVPREFMLRRGAIVFELLGKDALAVVMNPYDKQLRKDVETLADRKCHFYITMPSDFDKACEDARELEEEQALEDESDE